MKQGTESYNTGHKHSHTGSKIIAYGRQTECGGIAHLDGVDGPLVKFAVFVHMPHRLPVAVGRTNFLLFARCVLLHVVDMCGAAVHVGVVLSGVLHGWISAVVRVMRVVGRSARQRTARASVSMIIVLFCLSICRCKHEKLSEIST